MNIEREQVQHVAALARLQICEDEQVKWSEQMGAIIEFADQLNELKLEDIEDDTLHSATVFNVFREDERKASFARDDILKNSPEQYEGCYVVPKIVE